MIDRCWRLPPIKYQCLNDSDLLMLGMCCSTVIDTLGHQCWEVQAHECDDSGNPTQNI